MLSYDPKLRRSGNKIDLVWQAEPETAACMQNIALRKLRLLNQSKVLSDLRLPPGNRLESLKGDRAGQFSIRINDQWRICFTWKDGGADHVGIIDYHD